MSNECKELISVIVPIFNVEKYLKKCIDSIINQTYKNLEIILVDDGSTDNSPNICDEYIKKDSRVKVVHKENGGLSSARNVGLDLAKGELIAFVDSDDYIELEMYEKLKSNMDKYDSDIAICQFKKISKYFLKKVIGVNDEMIYEGKDIFLHMGEIKAIAWNKLYRKQLFKNIKYPEGRLFEDMFVLCDILNNAKRVSVLNEPLYNYTLRKSSISRSYDEKHLDMIDAFDSRINFFEKHKYLELKTRNMYLKVLEIISFSEKVNVKKLTDKRVKKYIDIAEKTAQEIQNSEYLNENEKRKVKDFLQDKEVFYQKYCFKRKIKNYIFRNLLYYN